MDELYEQMPLLVIRLRPDGMVLGLNPHVTRITGYEVSDLIGRNWWATLFPGRLFAQVPKFFSSHKLDAIIRDFPMTLRTKDGKEKTVAFTRFLRQSGQWQEVVCLGQDLTDRLTDADRQRGEGAEPPVTPELQPHADAAFTVMSEAELQGDFIMPLAISPPVHDGGELQKKTIEEVHEFLSEVEKRMGDLERAYHDGKIKQVQDLAESLQRGAHACGLLHMSSSADRLIHAAEVGMVEAMELQVREMVEMCRKARG